MPLALVPLKTTLLSPKKHGKNVENPCIISHIGL
nr:MAG TPA: hypothetical protein [Caudoviricetes sp.]